jgi:hypothetical protein
MDGLTCPHSDLSHRARLGFLPGAALCHRTRVGSGALLGDTQPAALDTCGGVDCLVTCIIDFYIERMTFYQGMFTLRWNCYGAYAHIPGRATITDSDGKGSCTHGYVVRCAGFCGRALSSSSNGCFHPPRPGADLAYSVNGSPRVGWLDARVPPGLG